MPEPSLTHKKSTRVNHTHEEHTKEAVSLSSSVRESAPKSRIATIQVCWIEDNARSLNNRLYPEETVTRLIISGQRKLADSNALPITCFLSHADADNDHTPALIGRAVKIWREGTKGMAQIDLADTSHARDALGLIMGGYIRTESLRASNAELKTDKRYDVPIVGGSAITLDGIDLTNYPGLEACARIQQVQIAESAKQKPLVEVFDLKQADIHQLKEGQDMPTPQKIEESQPINEEYVNSPRMTGDSPSMDGTATKDAYSQAMYNAPVMTNGQMQGMMNPANSTDVQEAHDRIAIVQNRACAPGRESARWNAIMATLSESDRALAESGKAISTKNDAHLDAAHHATARVMSMSCEGKNNKVSTPVLPDADMGDGNESAKKGTSPMATKEDALKLLESLGYEVQAQPKKSEAEILRAQIAAMEAKQAQQMEEMKTLFTASQKVSEASTSEAPQRKSMVSGANVDSNHGSIKNALYQHGKYLQEQIGNADWEALTDRTCPLPENIELGHLIKEFEQLYAVQYDERFKVLSATELR